MTHVNINGIRAHTQEKSAFLQKSQIFSIQDTRLRPQNNYLNEIFPTYNIYETKHDGHCAGVAILIKNYIKHQYINSTQAQGHTLITVKITDKRIFPHDLYISSLHVRPSNGRHSGNFPTQLLQQSLAYKYAITLGDFNARHTNLGCKGINTHGRRLQEFLNNSHNMILNNTADPTFYHTAYDFSDTIDYAIATPTVLKHIRACYNNQNIGSDHLPITVDFRNVRKVNQKTEHTYNTKLTNWPHYEQTLEKLITRDTDMWPPKSIQTPLEITNNTNKLITHFQTAISTSTPKHRAPNPDRPRLPHHVLLLIRSRRQLTHSQRLDPKPYYRKQINELNKAIKKEINKIKIEIAEKKANVLQQGPRNKQFWHTVKSLLHPHQKYSHHITHNNRNITNPEEKTNLFTKHFEFIFTDTENVKFDDNFKAYTENSLPDLSHLHNASEFSDTHILLTPITIAELKRKFKSLKQNKAPGPDRIAYEHIKQAPNCAITVILKIYNAIIKTAFIPPQFKTAIINVIPKPNKNPHLINSYRPITLAPTLGKAFEKIINSRLLNYAMTNRILNDNQTAFLPGKETTDNILSTVQLITNNFNKRKYTLIVSLDIQQAFDRAWHAGILHTIIQHTSTHFGKLISSFLKERKIKIRHENTLSPNTFTPTQGVPQGSPLSPLLFNLLLSTAPFTDTQKVKTNNYADDFFFSSTGKNPTEAWKFLEQHINNFIQWCDKHRLNIQSEKTNLTFFSRRRITVE